MSKRLSDKAKPRTLIYTVAIDYPIVEATKPLWLRQSEISNCDFKVINKNYLTSKIETFNPDLYLILLFIQSFKIIKIYELFGKKL